MRLHFAPRRVDVELDEWRGGLTGTGDQDVVERRRQRVEEPAKPGEVGRVEGGDTPVHLEAGALYALGVSRRDDHLGALLVCQPGGLEPDAGTPADHEERLT